MRICNAVLIGAMALLSASCAKQQVLPFAAAFAPDVSDTAAPLKEKQTDIEIAGGALSVISPDGFCVSNKGLKKRANGSFVLFASCDALGQSDAGAAQFNAFITLTTIPRPNGYRVTSDDLFDLAEGNVDTAINTENMPLVQVSGGTPVADWVSDTHWRGAFTRNGHIVMLALYAEDGGRALTSEGADLLRQLERRTTSADEPARAPTVTAEDGSEIEDEPKRRPLLRRITGIFDRKE
jgi:hypothetical protein